ncbi:MAG: hypothetical protein AAFQ57_05795 [Cyanobacteria bacterium J06626_14]
MEHSKFNRRCLPSLQLLTGKTFSTVSVLLTLNLLFALPSRAESQVRHSTGHRVELVTKSQEDSRISQVESKVAQCNRLAEVVNKAQGFMPEFERSIQAFSQNASQVETLDDIKAAAQQYITAVDGVVADLDGLVVELGATELSDEQLLAYRDRYTTMVAGFRDGLTQASDAMAIILNVETESELPAKIEESQQQTTQAISRIQELSTEESTIISEVNVYCGATGQ